MNQKTVVSRQSGKKAYTTPTLEIYGGLAEITANNARTSTARSDGGRGNPNTH